MKPDRVSVIVPCYNSEKYISESLNSIIKQTYKNIEIIVVDDGSTDKTIEVINSYKKRHNLKLITQQHLGVSAARNNGVAESKGEYVFFLDSDDTLNKRCIETLVRNAIEEQSDLVIIRQPNKFIGKNKKDIPVNNKSTTISGLDALYEQLTYKIVVSSWGRLYKKAMLTNNQIRFDEHLKYGEGFNYSIEAMLYSKKVTIIDDRLYNYRLDSTTSVMSTIKPEMVKNSYAAIERIKKNIPKNARYTNALKYAKFHTSCDLLNTITATGISNIDDISLLIINIKSEKFNIKELHLTRKEIAKIILYKTNPVFTSRIITRLYKRKFHES